MKIAMIGPGIMPIPPKGWGGTESLIWQYYNKLTSLGHEVEIFNTKDLASVAQKINEGNYDFVHLEFDEYVDFFARHLRQPFCSTGHLGYILKEHKWPRGYFSIYADFFKSPGLIAISREIQKKFLNDGYKGASYVVRVGIDVPNYAFKPKGNGKAICLGKIEPRKKQAFLARELDGAVHIDFVGPNEDPDFKEGKTMKYLGSWTKQEVFQKLSDYSCLVLFSDGEAAPMVIPEALASGVSVVASQAASANLDPKPFITILEDDITDPKVVADAINAQIQLNDAERKNARAYAEEYFDNEPIMKEYLSAIADFKAKAARGEVHPHFSGWKPARIRWATYVFSRTWLALSRVSLFRKILGFWRKRGYTQPLKK